MAHPTIQHSRWHPRPDPLDRRQTPRAARRAARPCDKTGRTLTWASRPGNAPARLTGVDRWAENNIWLNRNRYQCYLVEKPGVEPGTAILQGSPAARCFPLVDRWMVPGVGFEPTSPRFRRGAVTRSASQAFANWRGRGESNSFHRSGAPALNQSTTSAKPSACGASPRIRTSRRPTCLFHRRRFYRPVAGQGREEIGGGLRVRTPVLADPSVFETDCRPLQRSPPSSK
jgi:hypothetical protein